MATKQKPKQPKPPAKPRSKKPAKAAAPTKKAKPQKASKPAKASKPETRKPQPPPSRPLPRAAATAEAPQKPAASPTQPSPQLSSAPSRSIPTLSAASPIDGGTRYLNVQDVVELHKAISTEFGGTQAHPGVVESQFGLLNAVQRPQVTTLGREAYPQFADKVAAFVFALLQARPFRGGNRRVALASIFAFCELNNRSVDSRVLDEKTAENLLKRAASYRELGIPPENVFGELRDIMRRAIGNPS